MLTSTISCNHSKRLHTIDLCGSITVDAALDVFRRFRKHSLNSPDYPELWNVSECELSGFSLEKMKQAMQTVVDGAHERQPSAILVKNEGDRSLMSLWNEVATGLDGRKRAVFLKRTEAEEWLCDNRI